MSVGLAMADDGFDSRSPAEFILDLAVDAALLPRAEDPARPRHIVAPIAGIDIGPLDGTSGQCLGLPDDILQGVAVVRATGQGFRMEDELATLAAPVGGGQRDLDAELVRRTRLALADALGLGGMP